jgi:methyltransferase (TIGR00027 family)
MIVRTAVFDELILDTIQRQSADMIINLAAGLDTRPWRLVLPPALRWIDVDLPDILEYKVDALRNEKPVCRYEAVATDLRSPKEREALFSRLAPDANRVLIVTEGLLVYLKPEHVSALAKDLHHHQSFRWWLFDLASPRLLRYVQKSWGDALQRGSAPFQFAPAEGTGFFRPLGWREIVFRSSGEEAARLHREMRGMWFWRFVAHFYPRRIREEFRKLSGIVLVERDDN